MIATYKFEKFEMEDIFINNRYSNNVTALLLRNCSGRIKLKRWLKNLKHLSDKYFFLILIPWLGKLHT